MSRRPRVGCGIHIGNKFIVNLFSAEHDELMVQQGNKLPHEQLVPYLVAAREKDRLYTAWSAKWDDPII